MTTLATVDCVVVGGGPAGLAAAIALARLGVTVELAGARLNTAAPDTRTAALFPVVVEMLRKLGAWGELEAASAPLRGIRIVDDTGRVLRAPEIVFHADDAGLPDLGHNVPNAALVRALDAAARRAGVQISMDGPVTAVDLSDAATAVVRMASGRSVRAKLVVGADGRGSICRQAAGIGIRRWSYEQTAVVTRFHHSRVHNGISIELHRPGGPCTTVPMPGKASSLVWVETTLEAQRLLALPSPALAAELERGLGGVLGDITAVAEPAAFALSGLAAETLAQRRTALVGEAGHVLPPIGAQGLNLGMFDVAVLAQCVGETLSNNGDIGGDACLDRYRRTRAADMRVRSHAVDLLNRSLTSGMLAIDMMRGAGLHLLAAAPALRRRLILQGLSPPAPLPPLMIAEPQ